MRISEVAKQSGLPISTIRYYEKEGIIPDEFTCRDQNNYRIYNVDILRHLEVVKTCLAVGFSIHDLKAMMAMKGIPKEEQARMLKHKISEIEAAQANLEKSKQALVDILGSNIWCEEGFGKH
ncbi:MerR family transcriptional regulator [Paenibacillus sp. PL2-23]|uniref:helix-turn-helix domain-containing protein n=1 Tax=Paenibacillus sp. PL2-23 TaxID=2100729 RepID=UPI0030F8054B